MPLHLIKLSVGATSVKEKYYAITAERRIKNAAALAVLATAKSALDE